MIDKPIIEALASLGTGIAPRFHWDADALSLKCAIDSLAVNRMSLPGLSDNYDALMAMAMGQHLTQVLTTRHELPEKRFRRVATIAMQFGASLAEIALTLKGHEQKVVKLLKTAQTPDLLVNEKPNLQTLLIAATCASKIPEGEALDVISACRQLLIAAAVRPDLLAIVAGVMDAVQTAEETKDFAEIATNFFPDVGEQCQDSEINESEAVSHNQGDQPSDGPAGDSKVCAGQLSTANESENSEDSGQESIPEGVSGASSKVLPEKSEPGKHDGTCQQPDPIAGFDSQKSEAELGKGIYGKSESDSRNDELVGSEKSCQEVNSEQDSAEKLSGSIDDDKSTGTETEAFVKGSPSHGLGIEEEQTSVEELQQCDGPTASGEFDTKEASEPESKDVDQMLTGLSKGGFEECEKSHSSNKLHFAKNQSLVSELVRILQSEDKRTTKINDRGRKIAANKVWRFKKLGDARIFKQTSKVVGSQIAVELLIDASHSMQDHLKLACEVGLSFCDAIQRLTKASSAMCLFSGRVGVSSVLKEHSESFTKVGPKLTSVIASGGTPTGMAMMQRLEVLAKRSQERKLMVVITDGAANDYRSVLHALKYADDNGIDVIGIGLGLEGRVIKTYIDNSLSILSLNELQPAIRELMSKRALALA